MPLNLSQRVSLSHLVNFLESSSPVGYGAGMKRFLLALLLTAGLPLVLTGCGPGKTTVNTAKFEQSFQGAAGENQSNASAASAAIKSGDLASAATAIEKIIKARGLNDEQQAALSEVIIEMQKVAYENAEQYADEVRNKLSDLSGMVSGAGAATR